MNCGTFSRSAHGRLPRYPQERIAGMASHPKPRLTEQEYLDWQRASGVEERAEFEDGEVYPVEAATGPHAAITWNVAALVSAQLDANGPCRARAKDQLVRAAGRLTYPDVVIACPPEWESTGDVLTNPLVIVEMMSRSTEGYDRGAKFEMYRAIPSLREYILIAQERIYVEQWQLASRHWQLSATYTRRDCELTLGSAPMVWPVAAVYRDLTALPE
jgi:Uma2 family endonuclease